MSYETAIHTKQMASACVFCNRPLIDAESIERGCGPDCARKYGIGVQNGPVDEAKIEVGLGAAPESMQRDVAKYLSHGDLRQAVQRSIWHAAVGAEYGGDGARQAIASAHTIAQGAGFYQVADQIAKMHIAKAGLRLQNLPGGRLAIFAPYNVAYVSAIKNVEGRKFERLPDPAWTVPEKRLPEAINALAVGFPGYMAFGTDGNLFAIPTQPIPVEPPRTTPAGAPEFETREEGPKRPKVLSDLKVGDRVLDADGNEREVGWIGERKGDPRVGLKVPGQRGYQFMSYSEVTFAPAKEVRDFERGEDKERSDDARAMGGPQPEHLPPVERQIPEAFFGFQVEGVRWFDKVKSGLLGDDMGLGKTAQSIIALDAPCVVVCPATLRMNWAREIGRWRPELSTQVIVGKKPIEAAAIIADVVIVNYDILPHHLRAIMSKKWTSIVIDEAQYIKTLKLKKDKETGEQKYEGSGRAVATATLASKTRRRMLLSGTPMQNRPAELWPLLHVIDPKEWDSFFWYGKKYCAGYKGPFGWDFSGSSNEEELHRRLSRYMLRRMKTEVLKDLPEKSRESILVVLSEAEGREYHKAAQQFLEWVAANGGPEAVESAKKAETLTKMTALRRLSAEGKVEAATEWVQTHHESTGRPLVVMGHHATALEPLVDTLGKAGLRVGTILGGDSASKRQKGIDGFQAGELDVVVCSILAAGVGITLTAAQEMLFLERAWRPSDNVQAEDRIYRIGQKNACQITYMDGSGTIDSAIASLLRDKVSTIAAVVDGKALSDEEAMAEVMGDLFREVMAANAGRGQQAELWPAFNWMDPAED
jgi:SWI/SNF-related matrix-associated actin-dependent regulator of chromatin subfamily A-like protein 1